MDKIFVQATNGRGYDKFSGKYKYILTDRGWNDFGYYTIQELFLVTPDDNDNVKLADLHMFNYDQHSGEHLDTNITNYVGYISTVESAERILLLLSPDERNELISALHINFMAGIYANQHAFLKSVLRGLTLEEFEERQAKIKAIVSISEDITSMIENNRDIF